MAGYAFCVNRHGTSRGLCQAHLKSPREGWTPLAAALHKTRFAHDLNISFR